MLTKKMLCPACKAELTPGEACAYQTLDEHVCCPNRRSSVRPTWVCTNSQCGTYNTGTFWSEDGEGPYGGSYYAKHEWIDGNPLPFNSYHRAIYFQCGYHDEDVKYKLGKLTVRKEITYLSDDFGNKTGKRIRHTFWWKNMLYISGLRMLIFSLKTFYRIKKIGPEHAQEEVRCIKERSTWSKASWWRKAAVLWVKVFHRNLYAKALKET